MASKATAKNGKIAAQLGQPGFDREAEGTLYDRPKALKKVPPSLAFAMFPPALGTPLWALGEGGSYLADTMTWSYINHNWETAWSGNLLPGKHTSGLFGPLEFRPKPHAQLGEAVSATWSYNTRRWNITYEVDFSMESARFPESTQSSSGLGQKRSREAQPESQTGTVDAQPQKLSQPPSLPVQQPSVADNNDLADKHRNKKRLRDEDDDLADEDHDKKRFCD